MHSFGRHLDQPFHGGLTPSKVQRTTASIQAHLARLVPRRARRCDADKPDALCAPVQAGDRADAAPVRHPVPDGACEALADGDHVPPPRDRRSGRLRRPTSLHRAVSALRRYHPPGLPRRHLQGVSAAAHHRQSPGEDAPVAARASGHTPPSPCVLGGLPFPRHDFRTIRTCIARMPQRAWNACATVLLRHAYTGVTHGTVVNGSWHDTIFHGRRDHVHPGCGAARASA
jgi:hypothetical protein